MAVKLSPFGPKPQFFDSNGNPLTGGFLYFYTAGSSTPQNTYTTSIGNTSNDNPIELNSRGECDNQIWFTEDASYKAVLKTAADVEIWSSDNLVGINDTSIAQDEWVGGTTPTYISATSFSVTGDQSSTYHVGRRIKSTNTGGTIYSTISVVAYTTVTTVTVVNDSGTLDSGLSAVSYGLQSATNPSSPLLTDDYPLRSDATDKTKKFGLDVANIPTGSTVRQVTGAGGILPAGIGPLPFAGSSIPAGWLECDGSAVSRTTYAALFTAIGTAWGVGDGTTTFNLPSWAGRVSVGAGTGTTSEAVTASSSNGFTVTANNTKWVTGMTVVLSNLTGFTTSATAGPTYYAVRVSSTNVRLATTLALAQAGSPDITLSGSGTATLTHTYTARTLGEYGGEESHAMSSTELLAHVHINSVGSNNGTQSGAGAIADFNQNVTSTTSTGGNAAMNNMQPFGVTKMIISY
jgi:microcystin-dependent protein